VSALEGKSARKEGLRVANPPPDPHVDTPNRSRISLAVT